MFNKTHKKLIMMQKKNKKENKFQKGLRLFKRFFMYLIKGYPVFFITISKEYVHEVRNLSFKNKKEADKFKSLLNKLDQKREVGKLYSIETPK